MKKILILFTMLLGFSCQQKKLNTQYVLKTVWNYDTGFRATSGDFIFFDKIHNSFELKGDTIFYKGHPCARIIEVNEKKFNLIISSIDGKNLGNYVDSNEGLYSPNR